MLGNVENSVCNIGVKHRRPAEGSTLIIDSLCQSISEFLKQTASAASKKLTGLANSSPPLDKLSGVAVTICPLLGSN